MYSNIDLELFKIFWRKELSFGCVYYPNTDDFAEPYLYVEEYVWLKISTWRLIRDSSYEIEVMNSWDVNILWHEPTITDVFSLCEKRWWKLEVYMDFIYISDWRVIIESHLPYNPTLPLLAQSDETKSQLINLFK